MKKFASTARTGFTLAEILLAMLVFAIAISTILALLARSVETAQEILTKDEAMGLSSAVEGHLNSMSFLEAYNVVRGPGVVLAYKYRGNPDSVRNEDGTLIPVNNPDDTHVLTPGVRVLDQNNLDPLLDFDLEARSGRLFWVNLSVSEANPAGTTLPDDPNLPSPDGVAYNSAVLVVLAKFYVVPTRTFVPPDTMDPVFAFNFAVRR